MDDLSGLDWSKPARNQPKPPVMNSSAFASLRPTGSTSTSGRSTPASTQGSAAAPPPPRQPQGKPAQDSFSNLMNFGPGRSAQNLSLAERQAQLEAEKRKKAEEQRRQTEAQFGNGQFWDTLGNRGASNSPSLQKPVASNGIGRGEDDDDLFAAFNKDTKVDNASYYPPPESQRSTPANGSALNLSDPTAWGSRGGGGAAAAAAAAAVPGVAAGGDHGNFDDDDDPFGLNEMRPAASPAPRQTIPDDDDFLGDLGRPVDEVRSKQNAPRGAEPGKPIEYDDSSSSEEEQLPPRRETRREEPPERKPKVNKDPFDKALAQLVDYGFTAEDATRALVESGSGYNAQAAVNWLLDEAHRKSKEQAQGRKGTPSGASGSRPTPPPRNETQSPDARADNDLAKSAASVGNSLFKTANSLWKTSQKRMQQAVAELQQEGGDPSQPKWMRDVQQEQARGGRREENKTATDEAMMLEPGARPQPARTNSRQAAETSRQAPQTARRPSPAQGPSGRSSPAPRWQQQSAPPDMSNARSRLNRLASDDDTFSFNTSANRRKKPTPTSTPKEAEREPDLLFNTEAPKPSQSLPRRPATEAPRPQAAARPRPRPTPSPRPTRQIPSISPAAVDNSTKHRLQGTAHFKRGDYSSAHSSYSASLAEVPASHPLAIVLLTNRALTALKTGEPKQAVSDADTALQIIGPGNGHGETVAVKTENGPDEQRDMRDLFGKALSRKAEALEQMEKWRDAADAWHQCVESGVGGPSAIKGRQRCQEALAPKPKAAAPKPAAKPRPRPSATADLGPKKDSEAVTRLREANQAAAKEDDEKFALSEQIDAKMSSWRDGKRDNLRALLGSLDTVLWEGSGWKKVGMHELVMANKVKIVYMKAIAKTHPDKIPRDANTEVQLIAGLVFSTLNESWDKFRVENGL